MHRFSKWLLSIGALVLATAGANTALAGSPQFSNSATFTLSNPYASAQTIPDPSGHHAIYGRLSAASPIDVYSFKATADGSQSFSLLYPNSLKAADFQPLLIFIDPTDATPSQDLSIPLPSSSYHSSLLKPAAQGSTFREPVLLSTYNLSVSQSVTLKKGTQYYLVIGDAYQRPGSYVLKLGDGPAWGGTDMIQYFGSWIRLQTDSWGGYSPFTFPARTFSLLLFLLGVAIMAGIFIIQEILAFLANRQASAGYLLVVLQPFTKALTWISLWFGLLGGGIYFSQLGWVGLPFVISLLFLVVAAAFLYKTLKLSPQLALLPLDDEKVVIPFALRKKWFFSTMVLLVSLIAFSIFLTMYLLK